MTELTFENGREVHEDWLYELRHKLRRDYENVYNFSQVNNINYLSALWFFKGNPVEETAFKAICNVLDVDYQQVQLPLEGEGDRT